MSIATVFAVATLAGCGSAGSTNTATSPGSTVGTASAKPKLPTAAMLNSCVNTLFTDLGAPPEHGGELEPAYVIGGGPGHTAPTLPRLSKQAGGGVLAANANQIDSNSSPVELYFLNSARAASRALPRARREMARTGEQGSGEQIGAAGNVIYLETGPVASKSVDAISDCLRQDRGEPIPR